MSEVYGFKIVADSAEAIAAIQGIIANSEQMGAVVGEKTAEVATEFEEMGSKIGETMEEVRGMLLTGLGIGALFEGFEFLKGAKEDFDSLEKSVANLHQTLTTMNYAAGLSEQQIIGQAEAINKQVVYSKASIIEAQAMLATFGNVKGNQFSETMGSVADYAAKFMGGDMVEAAKSLGIALDDPIKGVTRLHRQGVSFSDEQKKQIANYVKMGDLVKAQEIVLGEIKRESGGQAAAFASTDEGKVMQAKKNWEDVKLEIGETISKIEVGLIPLGKKIADFVKQAFESGPVQWFIRNIDGVIETVIKAVEVWAIYKVTMFGVTMGMKAYETVVNGVAVAQQFFTGAVVESETAVEGFKISLLSTGIGAFAIALAAVINAQNEWNSKLDETVQKLTHVKELTEKFDELVKTQDKINTAMSNVQNLNQGEKQGIFTDINEQIKSITDNLNTDLIPKLQEAKAHMKDFDAPIFKAQGESDVDYGTRISDRAAQKQAAKQAIADLEKQQREQSAILQSDFHNLGILQGKGVKSGVAPTAYTAEGGQGKKNALKTVDMTGAKGGLGESKIVQIHIQNLQQNNGVKESKAQADNAVQMLARAVNNFSASQGQYTQ